MVEEKISLRKPSYGLDSLESLSGWARRTVIAVVLSSLVIAVAMLVLYMLFGDKGFLLAGVLMLTATLVDTIIVKAVLEQGVVSTRKLVIEISRELKGPYALAGGGLKGLIISARANGGILIIVLKSSKAVIVYLPSPLLIAHRPLKEARKAKVGISIREGGQLGARWRDLRAFFVFSCKKLTYEGEIILTAPHPETPLEATWRGMAKIVQIRCPHPLEPSRLVSEVTLLLGH